MVLALVVCASSVIPGCAAEPEPPVEPETVQTSDLTEWETIQCAPQIAGFVYHCGSFLPCVIDLVQKKLDEAGKCYETVTKSLTVTPLSCFREWKAVYRCLVSDRSAQPPR
jgi:hypothetical protein